jgi:phosphoglycolate phosphatase
MDETQATTFERPIRAVLFDKDGTILDSLNPWAEALRHVCRAIVWRAKAPYIKHASEIVNQALASIGVSRSTIDRTGLIATSDSNTILAAMRRSLSNTLNSVLIDSSLREALNDDQRFRELVESILVSKYPAGAPHCRAIEGAAELLRFLYENGIPLGLATSDDKAMAMKQLDELGWSKYFCFFSFGDTALRPKPDPWVVLEFEKAVGVPVGEIAVVGDTDADYQMARAAGAGTFINVIESLTGMSSVLFSRLAFSESDVKKHHLNILKFKQPIA